MNNVYLYDYAADPPTWEIEIEFPEPPDGVSYLAAIIRKAPTKAFVRDSP